jgi:hypothetical protein
MAIQELRTFRELQDAVISRGKLDENKTAVRNEVKEKINTYYQYLAFKRAYRWSGETRPLLLREKYDTGTITVTNDSDTITGSSTSWTEFDHLWCHIRIGSQPRPYKIIRVASTTSITLDHPYVGDSASSVTYSIYRDEIGLYPDLQNIRKFMVPGIAHRVEPCGPEDLDSCRMRSPFRSGVPQLYTLNGQAIYTEKTMATFNLDTDFWEDNYFAIPRNKKLIIWPGIVSQDMIADVRYTRVPPPMNADDDEPLVPYENRRALVLGPLTEHYIVQRDAITQRMWEKENKQLLKEMESDVETVDDELILIMDRRRNRRVTQSVWANEEVMSD